MGAELSPTAGRVVKTARAGFNHVKAVKKSQRLRRRRYGLVAFLPPSSRTVGGRLRDVRCGAHVSPRPIDSPCSLK